MKLFNVLRTTKRTIKKVLKESHNYINDFASEFYPTLPTTLNLMINDICNSQCVMCNVWKRKQVKELNPEELKRILEDPLFKKIKYIGVSGGEPTLRKDLPKIFQVIAQKKNLKGTGIITNAIQADLVIEQIEKCYNICVKHNVNFNVMVSIDGIGNVHDRIRGREGNFLSACKVVRYLRDNTDIPLTIGCTAVKENVWHLDEVLDFCCKENVYGRFRVAEFIDRLYNNDLGKSIRNFNADERYYLALFFSKLEMTYEKNPSVRATYKNIQQMMFEGKPRQSGCPYRSSAVGLDSTGNLIYCSPKSPVLESCLEKSAIKVYRENIHLRNSIIANNCCNCIHDYHSSPTKNFTWERKEEKRFKAKFSVEQALKDSSGLQSAEACTLNWSKFKEPLIVGWYGTETAGDKAILGDIIHRLRKASPEVRITISSIYPFITKRTLSELATENTKIIKTYSSEYLQACKTADAVIMGGGPLMNMEPLGFVLQAFSTARKFDTPTLIEGCGIGPLIDYKYISAVKEILRLSTHINVRDKTSLAWVVKNTDRLDAKCSGDFAAGFVKDWMKNNQNFKLKNGESYFACFLRELTKEYSSGISREEFANLKNNFEKNLGKMITVIMDKTGLKPFFVPMHTFVIGWDDRDFARRFSDTCLQGKDFKVGNKIYSPQDILAIMSRSRFNICMRFHSVLFAETLDAPFIAIDYTGGGKIKGFLKDKGKENLMLDRTQIANGIWQDTLDNLIKDCFHFNSFFYIQ